MVNDGNGIETRMHGDIEEHKHLIGGEDYWHPANRIHKVEESGKVIELPVGHILEGGRVVEKQMTEGPVVRQYRYETETMFMASLPGIYKDANHENSNEHGLQVRKFDWAAWDDGCYSRGICQGYASIPTKDKKCTVCGRVHTGGSQRLELINTHCVYCNNSLEEIDATELHHRDIAPELAGIAEKYWQCPHCRQLQEPIQRAQGARLESYWIRTRGNRVVLWLETASQWYVLVTYGTIQSVAKGNYPGVAYAVGNCLPMQLPDEIAVTLARRFWYKITKGHWSNRKEEEN